MDILKSKRFNGWPLLYWIVGINSAAVIAYMPTQDLSGPLGVSEMIQMSVRCSVPLLYMAFAASAINTLFPGKFSRWLLRNRRYIGLSYASSMGWQLVFIIWMLAGYWEYYVEQVYLLSDLVFQVPGYLFIFAMTITSFHAVRRKMSQTQWHVLHRTGIYFLWFTVVDTYYYELTYYGDIQIIDYIYAAAGLLAYLMRVAAWTRLRVMQLAKR